ncbi:GAF domain-containing sensor histidine kinase [Novosphingobium sp. JCM 18896]|uniref:sensor histidine kinase n=1 Tax=Novosphingobium sp. JCM 18896 TaxID=2989731 RepID=UPI00222338E6|nr:GAF domain-containing sensor histidine kinase [Novosphingobium sp. JCM 18896]MCW1430098.1 GAF domain-containing sensor histidine kinase [Novosphingobium sp. JCM 18896]
MDIERFRGLITIQQAISDARGDLTTVMQAIVNERSVMPQSNGIVVELRDGDQLTYAAASGTSAGQLGLRLPLNASLSGLSILTGEPQHCLDSHQDGRVNRAACDRVGLRSMIVVPIPHNGQTVGVLKYHASEPHAYDEEDMLIAHLLVGPIAVGFSSIAEADAVRAKVDLQTVIRLKEELVSNISHELRTPVTAIAGSLALLKGGSVGELPKPAVPLIDVAARNAERLTALVNDLLDMDRLEQGRLSITLATVDLCELLRTVVEENAPFAARTAVTFALDVPRAPVTTETDAMRLSQAVTNLLSNAAKFSPAGSTVQVSLTVDGAQARIRVSDAGPGIPKDFRSRLFDRFSQATRPRDDVQVAGTGLGLAITKGIVTQLGGSIRLDEAVSQGATFEIALPLPARS